MITVKNLKKKYNSFYALDGIDINVKKGEVYGFIGKNGAGKSTTMNILAGLSSPTEGEATVNGKDIAKIHHPSDLSLGYLPEDPKFYPWLTAYETLEYLANNNGKKLKKEKIIELLSWGGLQDASHRKVGGFSRGMKQRLGICSAMIHNPELLILDEPSSALDPQGRSDVLNLIIDLKKKGKTIIFSSHILGDVERVCDTIGIIDSGKMVLEKSLQDMQRENIHPVFDAEIKDFASQILITQIKSSENILTVESDGTKLSIHVNDTDSASEFILKTFAENNITVYSFNLRKSTLEDMFIKEVGTK